MNLRTGKGSRQTISGSSQDFPLAVSPSPASRLPLRRLVCLLVAAVLCLSPMLGVAQGSGAPQAGRLAIHGKAHLSSGEPLRDTQLRLQLNSVNIASTRTDPSGRFSFSKLPEGKYDVVAEGYGQRGRVQVLLDSDSASQREVEIILVGTPDPQSVDNSSSSHAHEEMELSDEPNFAVAGVTDWTAAGGHGSDSSLRTSEALVHETLSLKPGSNGRDDNDLQKARLSAKDSESKLRNALIADPEGFDANYRMGHFLLNSGRFHEALPPLKKAFGRKPNDVDNENDLAIAHQQSGEFLQAQQHIQSLLRREERAEWHSLAAEVDEELGDPLSAVHEYQRAALMLPSEANYFNWGSELFRHRAVLPAQEVFEKGVKVYPDSSRMLAALGAALFSGARYDEAALRLCQASDLNPADRKPYEFMARIELASPTPLECIPAKLARFREEQPNNALANYFYAMAIWKGNAKALEGAGFDQIESLLTKAVTLDPKCADGYLQLGNLHASRLDYIKAITSYKKSIEANTELAEAHYRLAIAYDRVSEHDLAKQEFQLHDQIRKSQAAAVEKERREVKQFFVVTPDSRTQPDNPQ